MQFWFQTKNLKEKFKYCFTRAKSSLDRVCLNVFHKSLHLVFIAVSIIDYFIFIQRRIFTAVLKYSTAILKEMVRLFNWFLTTFLIHGITPFFLLLLILIFLKILREVQDCNKSFDQVAKQKLLKTWHFPLKKTMSSTCNLMLYHPYILVFLYWNNLCCKFYVIKVLSSFTQMVFTLSCL